MVYPSKHGHPSKYSPGPMLINFVDQTNAANHYTRLPTNLAGKVFISHRSSSHLELASDAAALGLRHLWTVHGWTENTSRHTGVQLIHLRTRSKTSHTLNIFNQYFWSTLNERIAPKILNRSTTQHFAPAGSLPSFLIGRIHARQ